MNIGTHQIAESPVNHLMPLDLGLALKDISDDESGKMPAATLYGTGMPCMRSAVVADLQLHRSQSLLQNRANFFDTIIHWGNTCLNGLMVTRA